MAFYLHSKQLSYYCAVFERILDFLSIVLSTHIILQAKINLSSLSKLSISF